MTRAIEFYFDFVSPSSYLACAQLPGLARQHGAEIVYRPFRLLERAANDDVVARFDRETAAAAERGLFGSPSFVVGDELFFGNDRLDFVAAALTAANA